MTEGTEIRVTIESLAVGGAFVGSIVGGLDSAVGKKAFVADTLPGEEVIARITRETKSFVEAELVSITRASPDRVDPPCQFFYECGGCQLQHIPIKQQRSMKQEMVTSFLSRRGLVPERTVSLLTEDLPAYAYRNRVTLHLAEPDQIGFYRRGSGEVVALDSCLIASDTINAAIEKLTSVVTDVAAFLPSVVIEEQADGVSLVCKLHHNATEQHVETVVKKVSTLFECLQVRRGRKVVFRSAGREQSGGHFSQVNTAANEVLVQAVLERLSGQEVDDLYAGSGNFSVPLAARGTAVRAVELDSVLVKSGIAKAKAGGLTKRLQFVESSCERFARREELRPTVLLDPPRAGAREVVRWLDPRQSPELVYVSCSLPTFARDASTLVEKGYTLLETRVLDMFPQTHHVELLSVFRG